MIQLIGFMAGVLGSISMIPEIILCYRHKSTKDISANWLLINMTGQVCWVVYGILINGIALVIMSVITFSIVGFLLYLKKIKFK